MEKKLEKMKKEIQRQNAVLIGLFSIASGLLVLSNSGFLARHYTGGQYADFIDGFILGLVIVTDIICIFRLVKNQAAIKDEKKLTRLYNEMNDERTKQINALAGGNSVKMSMILLIVVALIVSFISFEAFLAIIGAVVVIGLVHKGMVLYYSRVEI
jgi:hypothetical protein